MSAIARPLPMRLLVGFGGGRSGASGGPTVVHFCSDTTNPTASTCDAEVPYFIDVAGQLALRYVATRCSPIFHGVQAVPSSRRSDPSLFTHPSKHLWTPLWTLCDE